jgi:hypothetical protein
MAPLFVLPTSVCRTLDTLRPNLHIPSAALLLPVQAQKDPNLSRGVVSCADALGPCAEAAERLCAMVRALISPNVRRTLIPWGRCAVVRGALMRWAAGTRLLPVRCYARAKDALYLHG